MPGSRVVTAITIDASVADPSTGTTGSNLGILIVNRTTKDIVTSMKV